VKKKSILVAAAFATLTALGGTVAWVAEGTASADTAPKVSLVEARATALRSVPGKIRKEELETEKGRQIYSFDINTGSKVDKEVNVDANTVVSNDGEDGDWGSRVDLRARRLRNCDHESRATVCRPVSPDPPRLTGIRDATSQVPSSGGTVSR
jgi:hypothetical protein